jgi:prepilin-type N-terminal cleavage/methylation domain-containing protein
MKKIFLKTKTGFTIIEVMISISLFLVIVMSGMTALLNASLLSQKSRDMRSIMDSLNFAMEDMSKNLRTGYSYHCMDNGYTAEITPQSCLSSVNAKGVSFLFSPDNIPVQYFINASNGISKIVNGGVATLLTPENVSLDPASSFIVSGAEASDGKQPFVTISLIGKIIGKNGTVSPFSLQTSVSQRLLDNR